MVEKDAIKLAKEFLCKNIELEIHTEKISSPDLYNLNQEDHILVKFSLFEYQSMIGGSKFIAVSKKNKSIRFIEES